MWAWASAFLAAWCVVCVHASTRSVQIIETAQNTTNRLTPVGVVPLQSSAPPTADATLTVDPTQRFQTMLGFGGAFTDSAAIVLNSLSPALYDQVMEAYFGDSGIQYTFGRVPMGACDFSTDPEWSYDDVKGDVTLENFTLAHDLSLRIPLIKDAIRRRGNNTDFKILGSPWSAPGWMKTNGAMICGLNALIDGCQLVNDPTVQQAYAYYFAEWVNQYESHGIPIWGVTVQNEPGENILTYEGMVFTPASEADFVSTYLGPTMADKAPGVKILYLDHSKDRLQEWADTIMANPAASKYLWGAAVHWYTGDHFDQLANVSATYPSFGILATEAAEAGDQILSPKGGTWAFGEHYAHDMMGDFNNNVQGFIDWNLALGRYGGPVHLNFILFNTSGTDSLVICDLDKQEVYFQTSFYYVGHLSKYVPPGSVRIGYDLAGSTPVGAALETVSFITPAQQLVTVIMNTNDTGCNVTLASGGQFASVTIPGHAIVTLLYPAS